MEIMKIILRQVVEKIQRGKYEDEKEEGKNRE